VNSTLNFVSLNIRRNNCIIFWIWNRVNLNCGFRTVILLFIFLPLLSFCNLPTLQYFIPFEIFLAESSPSHITNITSSSLSLTTFTTLTPSSVQQTTIPLHIISGRLELSLFPYFTQKRQLILMNFTHCERKHRWLILPQKSLWDNIRQMKPNSFCNF